MYHPRTKHKKIPHTKVIPRCVWLVYFLQGDSSLVWRTSHNDCRWRKRCRWGDVGLHIWALGGGQLSKVVMVVTEVVDKSILEMFLLIFCGNSWAVA